VHGVSLENLKSKKGISEWLILEGNVKHVEFSPENPKSKKGDFRMVHFRRKC